MVEMGDLIGGRYQINRLLAKGRFGETYLAEDKHLPGNPACVVKRLIPRYSEIARRLFDREAQVLYRLGKHPQIPFLFAHLEEERQFYLVQEFIDGYELSQKFIEGQPWQEETVISWLREILEIMVFVHQNKIIHRDISPSNMIRRQRDGKLILIDFGAVKDVANLQFDKQGRTQLTVAIGTPGYMPAEQANGKPKLSSDIYAIGIIAIQAITGLHPLELPEDPATSEIIWRDKTQSSLALADILDKMVRFDFRQRYLSAEQAFIDLQNLFNYP